MQRSLHNAIATAVIAMTATLAAAQPTPAASISEGISSETPSAQKPMRRSAASDDKQGDWKRHRAERMQKHLGQLKARLAIQPGQEPAWAAFAAALQPMPMQAEEKKSWHWDRTAFAQMTTPERIDRMHELRARRAARQDARGDAMKALYAALTPDQQKTFDKETLRLMRQGREAGGRRGHPSGSDGK